MSENESVVEDDSDGPELGPDEAFCTSCGEVIKDEAEICPECGVRQAADDSAGGDYAISDSKRRELENVADEDTTMVMVLSFLITPVGYLMIGKVGLAAINFFTLNYFLLGPIIVPFHTRKIIREAEEELRRAGVEGY